MSELLQDISYSLRLFRREPGFTAAAILTLAVAIGANSAIFGVVKTVLLDALPYAGADRLIRVSGRLVDGTSDRVPLGARVADTIVTRQQLFERIAAFDSMRDAVYGLGDAARAVSVEWVEPSFFTTLGVDAALGRTFEENDRAIGYVPASGAEVGADSARSVIVSHGAWQALLGGDDDAVGRSIAINGLQRTVIGVLPRDFVGPNGSADVYLAFDRRPALAVGAGWLTLVGRLKPGASVDAAQRQIDALWNSRDNPNEYRELRLSAISLRDAMVGRTRTPLLVLLSSAALVLLIGCANLAGVLLSRGLSRRREFGVRMALGAARSRVIRQLLTESCVLALGGGAVGLLVARAIVGLLGHIVLPVLPVHAALSVDRSAMLVTAVIALCAGLAFGVVPALAVGRSDAFGGLRVDGRSATEGRRPRRLRGALVALQLALCTSVVAGASALTESVRALAFAPLGFDSANVLTARFRLSTRDYPTVEVRSRFHQQLLERLRRLPGVDATATAHKVPTVDLRRATFVVDGTPPAGALPVVMHASVSDDYFRTLRIPLRAGRTFDERDRATTPATVVISENLARRWWRGADAIGTHVRVDGDVATVIGIVGDVRNDLTKQDADPIVYLSHRQESTQRFAILLRTRVDPMALVRPLEREVAALDPALPVQQAMTLDAAVADGLAGRRIPAILTSILGALALLLASAGVYALFAGMAAARTREFGVRIVLGSRSASIAQLLLRQGLGWTAAGLAGGAAGTAFVVRLLGTLIEDVPPLDPVAVGIALTVMSASAAVALLLPVWRAIRVDPIVALRAD